MTSSNPWMSIPAEDYEGHMGSPLVGQSAYLGDRFQDVLEAVRPRALVVVGAATGNGFERIPPETPRIVALDLNPAFLEILGQRFSSRLPSLHLRPCDLSAEDPGLQAMDLVHCGLVLEYLDPDLVVSRFARWLAPGGVLSVVLQQPTQGHEAITGTGIRSIQSLEPILHPVDPDRLDRLARAEGLSPLSSRHDTLPTGKRFFVGWYRSPG